MSSYHLHDTWSVRNPPKRGPNTLRMEKCQGTGEDWMSKSHLERHHVAPIMLAYFPRLLKMSTPIDAIIHGSGDINVLLQRNDV